VSYKIELRVMQVQIDQAGEDEAALVHNDGGIGIAGEYRSCRAVIHDAAIASGDKGAIAVVAQAVLAPIIPPGILHEVQDRGAMNGG
jgi:hypothetical protein